MARIFLELEYLPMEMTTTQATHLNNDGTLKMLARQVKERYTSAQAIARKAEQMMDCAIMEAILAGQRLCEVRSLVPHGEFEGWIEEHCPQTGHATAARYMALAKVSSMVDVRDLRSLRQAWTDLLSEGGSKEVMQPQTLPNRQHAAGRLWSQETKVGLKLETL